MNKEFDNLNQPLLAAMDDYAGQPCFKIKRHSRYQNISYQWFQLFTFNLVSYLRNQGLREGDRVVIVADNSLEWVLLSVACLLAGGTIVPLRSSVTAEVLHIVLQDCEAKFVILQDSSHIDAVTTENASTPPNAAQPEILLINQSSHHAYDYMSISAILSDTPTPTLDEQERLRQRVQSLPPETLALISYVTSSNGHPKGAVFDHARVLAMVTQFSHWLTFDDDDIAFTSRPWSETPNFGLTLYFFMSGVANALPESFDTTIEGIRQITPTINLAIPYSLERFYEACISQVRKQPEANQKVFQWALAKGKEYWAAGDQASPELQQEYLRADMTFFSQFRGQLGGRLRRLYVTGASLSNEVVEFFEAIGIPAINIYSLTEGGGFPAISQPDNYRIGSCGQVAPGFEIKIAADKEVLLRGPSIMREYWQQPDVTNEVFDDEGWLHSGDEGYMDKQGYLYITGRKHHLMVLSTGRKFSPAAIEKALTASPFINQVAVFGEGKPYISAMIVPNLDNLKAHFQQAAGADAESVTNTGHPKVKALLNTVINEVNSHLDRWEQLREFSLLEQPLSQDTGDLTPSMRVSRHVVAEKYAAQIKAMYPEALQLGAQAVKQVQIEPERLRALLEKETLLDAWMSDAGIEFLFELARRKKIDPPSMVNISDIAATIAQLENEEKSISTALIVGDPARIARVLPSSQVQILHHDHIRRMRKVLVTLAKMVDGFVLGYVVDRYGYVRGVHKLTVSLEQYGASLLGPQFRHHAAISKRCDAIVFFVPSGGRQVRVFADGELIGRYANGDWSPEKISHIDQTISDLATERGYPLQLIRRVLGCAFQMSEKNMGAIFLIGDSALILKSSDSSEIDSFATIVSTPMDNISNQELINFAKQDGATVIDYQGSFQGCMVLLRPDANTQAEIGPGKGARHSSAAKMSAETHCLAIVVSQDGPITAYSNGRRVLSL